MSSPRMAAVSAGECALASFSWPGSVSLMREIIPGTNGFYLACLQDQDGKPMPSGQLETVREKDQTGRTITIREMVGTGFTKRFGKWGLKNVVATREYSHDKYAKKEVREEVLRNAKWKANGREVTIWCKFVRSDNAARLGFKLPKLDLGNSHRPGSRGTGYEHDREKAPVAQVAEAAPVTEVALFDGSEIRSPEIEPSVIESATVNVDHIVKRFATLEFD